MDSTMGFLNRQDPMLQRPRIFDIDLDGKI